MDENRLEKIKRRSYIIGKLDAYHDFAWMKDGVTYLGTCGTRYYEFIQPLKGELMQLEIDLRLEINSENELCKELRSETR